MDSRLTCVIIAMARSLGMKSDYPKVLHEVAGESLLSHVLDVVKQVQPLRTLVVLGFEQELIKTKLPQDIEYIKQKKDLGSGHAIMETKNILKGFIGEVLVIGGDTPLLRSNTLKELIERHRQEKAQATVLTAILPNPTGYERIIRSNDRIVRIIEEKEATIYEKAVEEVNSRTYCFDLRQLFSSLDEINSKLSKYHLTDAIELMIKHRRKVVPMMCEDRDEVLRVNSKLDLSLINKILHRRIAKMHMENGVTIVDPETTFIDKKVKIGRDSIIYPFTLLEGETVIGERCQIGPGAHLISSLLGDGVKCRQVVIKDKKVKEGKDIGPYKVL